MPVKNPRAPIVLKRRFSGHSGDWAKKKGLTLIILSVLVFPHIACKAAASPTSSNPNLSSDPTPTPTSSSATYTFEVLGSACEIIYTYGSTSNTAMGNCSPFPNTTWLSTPWDYSFTSTPGTSYQLEVFGTIDSSAGTATLKKNGFVVTTTSTNNPYLTGTLP